MVRKCHLNRKLEEKKSPKPKELLLLPGIELVNLMVKLVFLKPFLALQYTLFFAAPNSVLKTQQPTKNEPDVFERLQLEMRETFVELQKRIMNKIYSHYLLHPRVDIRFISKRRKKSLLEQG
ncbi:MAG: hypothetical protein M1840_003374 [Geoglossum simile]|nr:MAG: hypothetical protein M1840_003374 [Geoglossum simile]